MKTILIQCPVWGTYDPPLALAQLSSCLKKAGQEVFVFDLNIKLYLARTENYKNMWAWEQCEFWYNPEYVEKFFTDNQEIIEQYIKKILKKDARVICFSLSSSSRIASLKLARMLKEKKKDLIIIFGGTLFFEEKWIVEILNDTSVDVVVPGEGEITLCELINLIEMDKDISQCKGILFKKNGQKIDCGERPLMENLDSLPFLDFSDLLLSNYDDSGHIALMTSRGCIMRCVFCSSREFWPGYRTMSGERIFQEIKYHRERHRSIGHINFLDLIFNGNMKALNTFCDLMIKEKFYPPIDWTANVIIRPEMTPEVLRKMKEAGCEHLFYGIESGSQRVLDMMKKRYRISDADKVIKATNEVGIIVRGNFMFGFPGETEEDFQMTLEFIRRNAKYLDIVYPSRTYCALEEFSYFHNHLEEFDITPNPPNHLYWESFDGKNTYPERLRRCEEFSKLATSLGIEVSSGVQTSVELDRYFNLAHYYEHKGGFEKAIDSFLKYYKLDAKNEVVLNKIKYYSQQIAIDNQKFKINPESRNRLSALIQKKEICLQTNSESIIKDKIQRRFTWNIHYGCNYRCPYCFFEGKWEEYKKRNIYLTVNEWMQYWNRIYENYGCSYILITGGEPFIYPNFIRLIQRLLQIHYPINISTNASGDLCSFVRKVQPDRVSLSVSFQPDFERLETFLEKVRFLRRNKFAGCINFVAYPPFIKDIGFYIEKFNSIGEELKIIPFWGKYQDKEYPFAYTQQEKEIIGINESWYNKVKKKDSFCPAGYSSALVFPDGKVARCGQVGERMLIGDFFVPEFKLLDKPMPCDAEFCPCDEDRLFGEEAEHTIIVYKNQKKDNEMNNSLLNDEEYNVGEIVLGSSPKAIFIQAAGPCNSSCVFCSRGPEYELFNLEVHRQRFEEDLYPFISRAETLILTGSGEFLRLPEAKQILDFFDNTFPQVEKFFSTNGSSLVPWVCERVVNSRSRYTIHISLHASNANLHKIITRTDNFHKILGQIKYLLELRKDKKSPKVHLIFVATTLNIDDLPNFVRLAAELNVDRVICYYNYIYIPTQKYLSCFFKQELTNRMFDESQYLASNLNIKIDLPPRFGQKEYPKLGPCREAWSQIMFNSQGHVLPCDASEDCSEILGNEKDFMDIWNSQYYQNLRKSLLEGSCSCFEHCLRANPQSANDFKSHVIYRGGKKDDDIHILWGDNF